MKKLNMLLTLLLLLLTTVLRGQGGITLLDKAQGQRVRFHYTYSLSKGGEAFNPVTEGDVVLEGNAYVLEGLGLKVVSDGQTRWTLDQEALEAVAETVQKDDVFTNPALFVGSYKQYMKKIRVNAQRGDYLDVTLTLDNETQARFVLEGVAFGPLEGKSDFSVDEKSLSESYVVTDLR